MSCPRVVYMLRHVVVLASIVGFIGCGEACSCPSAHVTVCVCISRLAHPTPFRYRALWRSIARMHSRIGIEASPSAH